MVRTVPELSDEIALKLAAQGDQEAFGVLYERYVSRIYSYIYYLPLSAWLYRIAHNLVANWHRDNSRKKEIPLDEIILVRHSGELPEAVLIENEEKENLLGVIHRLPADRQQLIILKFVEHLSNAEIGQVMGRSEGAVKSLYHRTLLSLRDDYELILSSGSNDGESIS